MKMLTYHQESGASSRRSNVSSAESMKNGAQRSSGESLDSGGHMKNDNVYKPFKKDKILNSFRGKSLAKPQSSTAFSLNSFCHSLKNLNQEKTMKSQTSNTKKKTLIKITIRFS